ncbi:hypothetical protein BJX96DRAFT_141108 [Aspergillus floccosus]
MADQHVAFSLSVHLLTQGRSAQGDCRSCAPESERSEPATLPNTLGDPRREELGIAMVPTIGKSKRAINRLLYMTKPWEGNMGKGENVAHNQERGYATAPDDITPSFPTPMDTWLMEVL